MRIEAAMVQFMLGQSGYSTTLVGSNDTEVQRVRYMPKGSVPDATLIVRAKAPTRKIKGSCACIYPDNRAGENMSALLESANDAIIALQVWDAEVKEALVDGMPLAQFVRLGERVLPYPYGFYDANSQTLGSSSNFAQMAGKFAASDAELKRLAPGDLPAEAMINLYEDPEYLNAFEHDAPFYYKTTTKSGEPWNGLCVNVSVDNAHAARLVIEAPDPTEPMHPGAELLVRHFASLLRERLVRTTNSIVGSAERNDSLHEFVREIVFEEKPAGKDFERALLGYGWSRRDSFTMVKFVFFEAVQWESAVPFICGQLERHWGCSIAVYAGRSIVWILNRTHPSWTDDEALRTAIAETARTYACRAGVSGVHHDFLQLQASHRACTAAMDIGKTQDPHFWYYNFEDYALSYALAKMTEDLPVDAIVSKKVAILKEVDEQKGTEFIHTLRCYIDNKLSATHTAKALFMHRTSFLRRLERIERISGIDFDNPDELLYVVLSLRFMR